MTARVGEQRLGGLRWIVVRGAAEEAFGCLGAHLREEIREAVAGWPLLAQLRRHVARSPGRERLAAVRRASQARFGEEWAELAALAAGAGVAPGDLALLNFRGDLGTVEPPGHGCSDLAWRRARSFLAHNEDDDDFLDGRCVLLTLALAGRPAVTSFWKPGFLPGHTITFAETGLVWAIDHLPVAQPGPGAGRHLVARGLQRAAATADEALAYLRGHPSAGGFAYLIGDRAGRVLMVESAAGQCALREAGDDGPLVWHTNHGRDVSGAEDGPRGTSRKRGDLLSSLAVPAGEPDAAWFLRVLAAPPPAGVRADPAAGDRTVTLCTFVTDLTGGEVTVLPRGEAAVTVSLAALAAGTWPASYGTR
jgi:Acyl-coenzyme A:6-aminopenicillanic acid acyl-transferase